MKPQNDNYEIVDPFVTLEDEVGVLQIATAEVLEWLPAGSPIESLLGQIDQTGKFRGHLSDVTHATAHLMGMLDAYKMVINEKLAPDVIMGRHLEAHNLCSQLSDFVYQVEEAVNQ